MVHFFLFTNNLVPKWNYAMSSTDNGIKNYFYKRNSVPDLFYLV